MDGAEAGRGCGPRKVRRKGVTLIEAVVTVSILAVGALTSVSVLSSSLVLDQVNRETADAYRAADAQMEYLRSELFDRVSRQFDSVAANDPNGSGTGPGATFAAGKLKSTSGGVAGSVILPVDAGGVVRENITNAQIGMPRDLNGDGVVDAGDHTADAIILPVAVRVQWQGRSGPRTLTLQSVLHR